MGFILSKLWWRESAGQQIERLQCKISSIQEFKRDTEARQTRLTKWLNILFCLFYALAMVLGLIYAKFYYHNPHKNMDFFFKFKIFMGFILAPLTFFYLKRGLSWWYSRRLNQNEDKLKELRDKKSKILDEVTEKETFKVAREILEKYAPESLSKYGMVSGYGLSSSSYSGRASSSSSSGISSSSYSGQASSSSGISSSSSEVSSSLRHRIVPGSPSSVLSSTSTSSPTISSSSSSMSSPSASSYGSSERSSSQKIPPYVPRPLSTYGPPRPARGPLMRPAAGPLMRPPPPHLQQRMPRGPRPLMRPVAPEQKGIFGKMYDYVVGEGPGSRYALICNQCHLNNGMAQEETYEYTAFRCCYCHYWNPPKKQKPLAPKLVLPSKPEETKSSSEEDKKDITISNSESNADSKSSSSEEEEKEGSIKSESIQKTEASPNEPQESNEETPLGESESPIVEDKESTSFNNLSEEEEVVGSPAEEESKSPIENNEIDADIIIESSFKTNSVPSSEHFSSTSEDPTEGTESVPSDEVEESMETSEVVPSDEWGLTEESSVEKKEVENVEASHQSLKEESRKSNEVHSSSLNESESPKDESKSLTNIEVLVPSLNESECLKEESKSDDSESDIDIIDAAEALEAMEIHATFSSVSQFGKSEKEEDTPKE
eukprot:TRINITY_DN1522_c0_g1_i1.p1 TRINITY_DN1522_c0_g1~~TRINITY_DN1522_c0_g1_i1.p1  ORF type:complete len:660 (+),score=163.51 TRINITY_DN1522_c0_g1_i1:126-2105(+)